MSNPIELTKEITVAWLAAYQTDLSIRRQKGIVPLFTPTNEEVMDFMSATYAKVSQLSENHVEAEAKVKKKSK